MNRWKLAAYIVAAVVVGLVIANMIYGNLVGSPHACVESVPGDCS